MKLYLISQNVNNGYGTYSDAVVAAESEALAKTIHPSGSMYVMASVWRSDSWTNIENVKAQLIGVTVKGTKRGVICSSFRAG